ncbi:MAG: tetratricopeptide repeat protein [Vicinamibacterales bacterium]
MARTPSALHTFTVVSAAALGALCVPPDSAAAQQKTTFNRDVAPVLYQHCVECHRPGGAAPFSLIGYADARAKARLIAQVTERRVMPPWQPLPEGPALKGARHLDERERRVLQQWVADGSVEGDTRDLPAPPPATAGWQLGEPDLVVTMPGPFDLPGGGADSFRNFVLPVPIPALRYVQAVELRPGNPRVVHHARIMVDDTGTSRGLDEDEPGPGYSGMDTPGARFPDGFFLGWAAGRRTKREATAWPLAPGTDLVVQLHLRPSGKTERVEVSVGLYFTDTPPAFTPAMLQMGARTLDIPAGDRNYTVTDSFVLPVAATLHRIAPHAHYLGRTMLVRATAPDAEPVTLLHIPSWDFNWQDDYDYAQPVSLPAGTRLDMRFTYDNSAESPRNPHTPPQRVTFGPDADDEMCELLLQLVPANPRDLPALQASIQRKTLAIETAELEKRVTDDPNDIEGRLSLGAIYMQTSRFNDGAAVFEAAARLAPDHAIANYNAGQVAFARRDAAAARQYLQRAVDLKPTLVEARTTLAAVLEAGGETESAVTHLRRALAVRPGHVPAAVNLARLLSNRNAGSEAIGVLEQALVAQPRHPVLLEALAQTKAPAGPQPPVPDLDGKPVTLQEPGVTAVVLVFVGTDCPISNRYAPEVRRLFDRFSGRGVSFVTVYPNPSETPATIRQHLKDYNLPPRAAHDASHALVARTGVSITPEVAVFDARGRLVYRGRIDDRHASVGIERPAPSQRDLEDVLDALAAGRTPPLRTTEAVGCFIADLAR